MITLFLSRPSILTKKSLILNLFKRTISSCCGNETCLTDPHPSFSSSSCLTMSVDAELRKLSYPKEFRFGRPWRKMEISYGVKAAIIKRPSKLIAGKLELYSMLQMQSRKKVHLSKMSSRMRTIKCTLSLSSHHWLSGGSIQSLEI